MFALNIQQFGIRSGSDPTFVALVDQYDTCLTNRSFDKQKDLKRTHPDDNGCEEMTDDDETVVESMSDDDFIDDSDQDEEMAMKEIDPDYQQEESMSDDS